MMNNGLFRAKLRETRGVRTVLPADDEHHVHFRRESERRRLSLIRRRTDGPEDADVVRFRDEPRRYGLELRAGTSRLSYDAKLRKRRKAFRFFLRLDDGRMAAGPFQDALDFRMLLLADDHDAVAVLSQPIRRFLCLLHMRAGGVDKPNRTFFRLLLIYLRL